MATLMRRKIETARLRVPLEALGWTWQNAGAAGRIVAPDTRGGSADASILSRTSARTKLFVRGGTVLLGLGALAFLGGFFVFVSRIERTERAPPGRADGIVALTGGSQRIGDAIDLLAAGYGRRLLISGVNERTSREELAKLNPSQRHLIECCVDLDYRARNTIGNAIELRHWMRNNHFGTVTVVTANYHMPRTLVEIEHALAEGESVVPYPVIPDGFDASRWYADPTAARLLCGEYVKFLAAWLRTRFEADPERSHFADLVGRGRPVKHLAEPAMHDMN